MEYRKFKDGEPYIDRTIRSQSCFDSFNSHLVSLSLKIFKLENAGETTNFYHLFSMLYISIVFS